MIEKRKKTTIEERVGRCECCKAVRLLERHHLLPFQIHGECRGDFILFLCSNCHALLHTCINAIIFRKKRATEVWNAFVLAIGKDNILVKQIEDKVYETADVAFDTAVSYSDFD